MDSDTIVGLKILLARALHLETMTYDEYTELTEGIFSNSIIAEVGFSALIVVDDFQQVCEILPAYVGREQIVLACESLLASTKNWNLFISPALSGNQLAITTLNSGAVIFKISPQMIGLETIQSQLCRAIEYFKR